MPVPDRLSFAGQEISAGVGSSTCSSISSNISSTSSYLDPSFGDTMDSIGTIVSLAPGAGCLEAADIGQVAFEMKHLCDQAVTDLTTVLRVGFVLKFRAVLRKSSPTNGHSSNLYTNGFNTDGPDWIAAYVAPLLASDLQSKSPSLIESIKALESSIDASDDSIFKNDPCRKAECYDSRLESEALLFILTLFQTQNAYRLPLVQLHAYISNSGNDELYRYIGKSSIKRRQFLERRSHVFAMRRDDMVFLVPAPIYSTILKLSAYVLSRGGAMSLQQLVDYYLACPDIPLEARDLIGEGKNSFLLFMDNHPWAFSVFPSRVFVSIRRRLVDFNFPSLTEDLDISLSQLPPYWEEDEEPPPIDPPQPLPSMLPPNAIGVIQPHSSVVNLPSPMVGACPAGAPSNSNWNSDSSWTSQSNGSNHSTGMMNLNAPSSSQWPAMTTYSSQQQNGGAVYGGRPVGMGGYGAPPFTNGNGYFPPLPQTSHYNGHCGNNGYNGDAGLNGKVGSSSLQSSLPPTPSVPMLSPNSMGLNPNMFHLPSGPCIPPSPGMMNNFGMGSFFPPVLSPIPPSPTILPGLPPRMKPPGFYPPGCQGGFAGYPAGFRPGGCGYFAGPGNPPMLPMIGTPLTGGSLGSSNAVEEGGIRPAKVLCEAAVQTDIEGPIQQLTIAPEKSDSSCQTCESVPATSGADGANKGAEEG